MEQIFKYAIILSLALPMFFLATVAIFAAIVVILDTAVQNR